MEEERIKSALEIAMERVSAMPELTPEEMAVQKEKQYAPIGEAMTARYLNGLLNENELPAELDKYPPDQKLIIRRALVSGLCRTMRLEGDPESAGRALNGLMLISPAKRAVIAKSAEEYGAVIREFEQEKQNKSVEIDAAALKPFGISGTAVRCNPAQNAHWLEALQGMRQSYEPRVESIRSTLQQELGAP